MFTGGKVGGFTIDEDSIEGGNLVLHSAGRVESADFSSGVMAGSGQGFRLSAEGNGFLEVENARIRGTLSTAVFEKETVNAVGGIMMIGNSTVITGSGGFSGVTASSATMSVENISGFTGSYNGFNSSGVVTNAEQIDGEILMIKKFDKDGFSTEYVCVQSASFNGDSTAQNNGTDLSGKLYVTRSFSGTAHDGVGSNQSKTGTAGFTGSYLPGGNAQNYEDGQVVVSTGKFFSGTAAGGDISGSGFIMLNAKSTDQFTPYIDIIQRTGSFVYSMELKARLGDLSGLSSALVGSDPGFGLFSENVFLTGKITATSGEIAGWGLVGNKITSSNGSVELDSTGPGRISLGGTPPTDTTGDGAFLSGSGEFYVGKNNGERLHFNPTGNGLLVSSSNFDLLAGSAGSGQLGVNTTRIALGSTLPTSRTSGDGFFVNNSGEVLLGDAANERLEYDTTNGLIIYGSDNNKLVLDSSGLEIYKDGQVSMSLEAGGVKVGPTASQHISIDSDSLDIKRGTQVSASFGTTTTIGPTTGQHISIDSDSLDVKTDASNIVASFGVNAVIGEQSTTTSHLKIITGGTTGNNGMSFKSSDDETLMFVGIGSEMDAHSSTVVGGANRLIPSGYTQAGLYAGNLMADALHVQDIAVSGGIDLSFTGTNAQQITAPVVNITSGDNFSLGELTNTLRMKGNSTDGFNFLNSSNGWADLNFRRGIAATDMSISGSAKVTGSVYAGGLYVSGSTGVGATPSVMINVNDGTNEVFQVTEEGEVLAKDNISAFASITSLSDKRLKEDIYTLSGSMNKILQLRPTEFTWKENKKQDIGFIAQEVEEIIPEVIHETKGFLDINSKEQDNTTYKTISYEKLTVYLVDTIKELTKRIEDLEKKDK